MIIRDGVRARVEVKMGNDGHRVIRKTQKDVPIKYILHDLLTLNAWFGGPAFITPEDRNRAEFKKLRELAHRGVKVPEVFWDGADWLEMEYVDGVRVCDAPDQEKAIGRYITELSKLHGQGLFHGDPSLPNAIISNGTFTFIDFNTIYEGFGHLRASARDLIILYINSALHRKTVGIDRFADLLVKNYGHRDGLDEASKLMTQAPFIYRSYYRYKFGSDVFTQMSRSLDSAIERSR